MGEHVAFSAESVEPQSAGSMYATDVVRRWYTFNNSSAFSFQISSSSVRDGEMMKKKFSAQQEGSVVVEGMYDELMVGFHTGCSYIQHENSHCAVKPPSTFKVMPVTH